MMLLGYSAPYGGKFGDVPVIQAGRFKLIHLKNYERVPLPLARLMAEASKSGAQFLIIGPRSEKANWVDVREAA
jgi:hypothetical protein